MLVLTRKPSESIIIDCGSIGLITVMLVEVRGPYQARIGIVAPKEIPVHRLEVWEAIQRDREAAE